MMTVSRLREILTRIVIMGEMIVCVSVVVFITFAFVIAMILMATGMNPYPHH